MYIRLVEILVCLSHINHSYSERRVCVCSWWSYYERSILVIWYTVYIDCLVNQHVFVAMQMDQHVLYQLDVVARKCQHRLRNFGCMKMVQ